MIITYNPQADTTLGGDGGTRGTLDLCPVSGAFLTQDTLSQARQSGLKTDGLRAPGVLILHSEREKKREIEREREIYIYIERVCLR